MQGHVAHKLECRHVNQARMAGIASTIKKNVNAIAPWAPDETLEDDPPMDWENWDQTRDGDKVAALAAGFIAGRNPRGQGMPSTSNRDNSPYLPSPMDTHQELACDDMFVMCSPHNAGAIVGHSDTYFECLKAKQAAGDMGRYGPFQDHEEWELAQWLMTSGVSQADMDSFLKLNIVSW